ncbi:MAG: hypothetical protein ACAI44_39665 [Candidatus Sericytochromatia bacterium]
MRHRFKVLGLLLVLSPIGLSACSSELLTGLGNLALNTGYSGSASDGGGSSGASVSTRVNTGTSAANAKCRQQESCEKSEQF